MYGKQSRRHHLIGLKPPNKFDPSVTCRPPQNLLPGSPLLQINPFNI
nr:hypothetical protein [Tawny frogmouth aviadenovirus A]